MEGVTIGAVGAAAIGAFISFITLIITKEQKISEFRQHWIESLRSDIISYLTTLNTLRDAVALDYDDQKSYSAAISPITSELNKSNFSIILRINEKENSSQDVIKCLNRFHSLMSSNEKPEPGDIRPIELDLIIASKRLLKLEWERVKRGETTFRYSKYGAIITIIIIGIIYLYNNGIISRYDTYFTYLFNLTRDTISYLSELTENLFIN